MGTLAGCAPAAKKEAADGAADKSEASKASEEQMQGAPVDAAKTEPAKEESTSEAPPAPEAPAAPPAPAETPAEKPAEEKAAEEKPAGAKVMLGSDELFAGIPGEGDLTIEQIQTWLDDPKNHEPLDFELPLGLSAGALQIKGVDKNPLTRAKIELGRQLYFDPRLSADVTISCASCHDPDEGFARHTQFGVGIKDQQGGRNSPVSYNRILSDAQFWDGRAASLEDQAVGPIANPIEMGHTHEACVECLKAVPGYKLQFEKIFGEMNIEAVGKALASFERAIVTGPTPFDYYEQFKPFKDLAPEDLEGEEELKAKYEAAKAAVEAHPMSEAAIRGRELYFTDKANCSACHVGANLTDEKYHNIGVGMDKEKPDIGREEVSKDPKDHGAFKTPTIRNVALTAPYMHDGSQKTLAEVVEWYAKGGHANPALSDKIKKLDLTDQDKADLVAFMEACTGTFPKVNRARLPQ
jgi:cytochrome c peroxidase